ncbi:MAG TPA: hypothetical protein VEJ43_11390 [Pseudolabrys sp.]|nr:hypothetical protein [Pseudolabrys sp.]
MAKPPPVTVTLKLRARYAIAGATMLALWVASVVALFRNIDWSHILIVAAATVTALPLGLTMLSGGVSGSEPSMQRAQMALFATGALLLLIVSGEVLRRIVFGTGG